MNRTLASLVLALVAGTAPAAHASTQTTAPAPSRTGQALDVLVLGDSYSAGNGATGTTYGPSGCFRNTTNWGEKYAAGLRARGTAVDLVNHACSDGQTPDFHTPRALDTQTGRTTPAPAGVATTAQADEHLRASDPCNTRAFPAEEFWTYRATAVSNGTITYDCTRNLRPQADFVSPDTDLVVFTMGGNDAGFSTIVQGCFVAVTRTAAACRTAVDAARALIPTIKQRLVDDVAALRSHGLREDAKIVQLGYPWLQVDNDFSLPDPAAPATPYPAGDAVRSLVSDATVQLATVPGIVNAAHPGQMTFVDGVTTTFAGHEPDAGATNPDTWINEAFSGPEISLWYHPNDLGQTAYAGLLLARGTFGAVPGSGAAPAATKPKAKLHVRAAHRRFASSRPVTLRLRVRLSDKSVPSGRLVVRLAHHRKPLVRRTLRAKNDGHRRVRVRGLRPGRHVLVVRYRDKTGGRAVDKVRVRIVRRS